MAKSTTTTTAATETTATETPKFATLAEENAYYNELVKVKLFKDSDKYSGDVFVGVNGVGMLVPRGVEVEIPRKYAEVLHNSELQDNLNTEYRIELARKSETADLNE